jgi:hypothetical protein
MFGLTALNRPAERVPTRAAPGLSRSTNRQRYDKTRREPHGSRSALGESGVPVMSVTQRRSVSVLAKARVDRQLG